MQNRLPLLGKLGKSSWRIVLLLVLSAALVVVVDWMAWFANPWVAHHDGGWGGDRLGKSAWSDIVDGDDGLQLDSRDLLIELNGDQLTARYTVSAPSNTAFAAAAATDDSPNSGNDLVDNVLGEVQVAEFRYGFTGDKDYYSPLSFGEPQLAVKGATATVTVESEPFRLYLPRQRLVVGRPGDVTVSGSDDVDIEAHGIQVADASGASIQEIGGSDTTLVANARTVSVEMWEDGASQGWLDGLRALGSIAIPVAGYPLDILSGAFVYLVLLWSLSRVARDGAAASDAVRTARKAVLVIVGGLSAAAFLLPMLRISEILTNYQRSADYIVAGPMGLLVAGAVVWWLTASLRIWSPDKAESPGWADRLGSRRGLAAPLVSVLCVSVVLGLYVAMLLLSPTALRWLDIPASQDIPVMILAAIAVALVVWIATIMFGGRVLPWLLSVPMTALILAAAAGWPLIWYTSFNPGGQGTYYVNAWGKWIYAAVVAAVVIGLAVMFARVFWVVTKPYGKPWQWVAGATAAAVTALAVLPDAISESGVVAPRSAGLVPYDLFNFFLALPSLLSWLLIVMALLVAIGLQSAAGMRPAARFLAIPIALGLFYGSGQWLYLPVTRLLGLPLVIRFLLPGRLATQKASPDESSAAKRAIDRWRDAEFVGSQRQALASSSTDALRDFLLKSNDKRFDKGLAALAGGQAKLSTERDRYRREARKDNTDAFSRYGHLLRRKDAKAGFIVGAILGIVPATVTVLATQPPAGNGVYPVLAFLGGTAWRIGVWALLGCFIGYFQPLLRGENGVEKGAWMFIVNAAPVLLVAAIWDDSRDWAGLLIGTLEVLVFLIVAAIILDDMRVLRDAGLSVADWTRVHNWRFVVTWSTTVIAAIGTAAVTFLSTAATDLSQETVGVVPSQVAPATSQNVQSTGSAR